MPNMKRRDMLMATGAATTAFLSAGSAASSQHTLTGHDVLTVYTQGSPQARDLAQKAAYTSSRVIPLAGDLVEFWKTRIAKHRGPIQGFTSWSEFVLLRGMAEENGMRLRAEAQLHSTASKPVFRWMMA